MLKIKQITKSYCSGDFEQKALNGISLDFRDSEFVAILGPSGSGKTTLLNVIGGLVQYDSGEYIINGQSTKNYTERQWDTFRNNEVGFIFQNYNLISHQTVLKNVELALSLSGVSMEERRQRAIKSLEDVGLSEHINKLPNQLSGGQQQRVSIARALINNPTIIFADEPTGALDTKTSVEVMDTLKDVSKNKLVVMVTHNSDLAQKYANRIVTIQDGMVKSDSNPINVNNDKKLNVKRAKEKGKNKFYKKVSMPFLTAMALSFSNLMGKKGRTFMTAFAGSIGIIGIASVLALYTGTQQYINNVETDVLSSYPLSITKTKSLITGLVNSSSKNLSSSTSILSSKDNSQDEKIGVRKVLSLVLSQGGKNDLSTLKDYLDKNYEDINSQASSIQYSYNVSPLIYASDTYGTRQVYPKNVLSSLSSDNTSRTSSSSVMDSNALNTVASQSDFSCLPVDDSVYKSKYELTSGRWAESSNECILVLNSDGSMSDSLLYTLGIRDYNEIKNSVEAYSKQEKVNLPENYDSVSYDDILNKSFKFVSPSDMYVHDASTNTFINKSEDTKYVENLLNQAKEIKIVGIVKSSTSATSASILSPGINFFDEINKICIDSAANSEVVKSQIANPTVDVLSNKTFDSESNSKSQNLDINNFIEVDTNAINSLFSFDSLNISPQNINIDESQITNIIYSSISPEQFTQVVSQIVKDKHFSDQIINIVKEAITKFLQAKVLNPDLDPNKYFSKGGEGYNYIQSSLDKISIESSSHITSILTNSIESVISNINVLFSKAISDFLNQLTNEVYKQKGAFSLNQDNLKNIIKIKLTQDDMTSFIKSLMINNTHSYESNLSNFGYANLSDPTTITIYPKDFASKDNISEIINKYNEEQKNNGNEDKEISFSDISKVLISNIKTLVDMIATILIGFVSISLVVSSIMIGIITYISVLERRREIGILRAIGARKRDIFRVFNAETFIIGLVAGLLGVIIATLCCIPANALCRKILSLNCDIVVVPVAAFIILIVVSICLTMVAGIIPAISASKKDPVEAINL